MQELIETPSLRPLVIGAAYHVPTGYITTQGPMSGRYARFENGFLLDHCIPLILDVLLQLSISVEELDVIATLSLTSDNMAYERDIAGSRLCHPIQKELKAKNAWVYDMADSSLSSALELAQCYLINNQKKYALIVRADQISSICPDEESGFSSARWYRYFDLGE